MLLTDYLLKFFTTGNEVQGTAPYAMRPLTNLLKDVPLYLKKIIEDFQKAVPTGGIHRFWNVLFEGELTHSAGYASQFKQSCFC